MYDIDKFYVGLIELNSNDKKRLESDSEYIKENGGICFDSIYEKGNKNMFLSVFYKIGHDNYFKDDVYMSLHDMREYGEKSFNGKHCKMIMPLKDILPKLSFQIPNSICINDARSFFDLVFKSGEKIKYDKSKYDIDNFYMGYLDICDSIKDENGNFENINTPQIYLINQSVSKPSLSYFKGREVPEIDYEIDIDRKFVSYYTMFYKMGDNEFYNLNDYQIYPERDKTYSLQKTDSFCSVLVPLTDMLKSSSIKLNKKAINIKQALENEKKLIKRI